MCARGFNEKVCAGSPHSDLPISFLLREGACIQRGIPLAQIDGQYFDLRVIVIGGEPRFTVFRLSAQPITNLHLGGRRGDPVRCRAAIPPRVWRDAIDDCVRAAALYDSTVVGVDVAFEHGFTGHSILEVNAFGDWFPGLVDASGKSVHRAVIETLSHSQR